MDELKEKMTKKRYFCSKGNRYYIYESDELRYKKFFESFTAILLEIDPSNKSHALQVLFKDQLVSSFIAQVMPWHYDKDISWLENVGISITDEDLRNELEKLVLDKY